MAHAPKTSTRTMDTSCDEQEEGRYGAVTPPSEAGRVTVVTDLDPYEGLSVGEKVDDLIRKNEVVIINRSWCLFSIDAIDFLVQMGIHVHSLETDQHPQGAAILKYLTTKYKHKT